MYYKKPLPTTIFLTLQQNLLNELPLFSISSFSIPSITNRLLTLSLQWKSSSQGHQWSLFLKKPMVKPLWPPWKTKTKNLSASFDPIDYLKHSSPNESLGSYLTVCILSVAFSFTRVLKPGEPQKPILYCFQFTLPSQAILSRPDALNTIYVLMTLPLKSLAWISCQSSRLTETTTATHLH